MAKRTFPDDIRKPIEDHLKDAISEFLSEENYKGVQVVLTLLDIINAFEKERTIDYDPPVQVMF